MFPDIRNTRSVKHLNVSGRLNASAFDVAMLTGCSLADVERQRTPTAENSYAKEC
jgi:hypothetical protein